MKNLKKLRKSKHLTQLDVAKVLDITVSAYGNYELGQRSPAPEMLIKLAEFFGVSVDYLLDRNVSAYEISEGVSNYVLTPDQEELLMLYNEIGSKLGKDAQNGFVNYARFLVDGSNK